MILRLASSTGMCASYAIACSCQEDSVTGCASQTKKIFSPKGRLADPPHRSFFRARVPTISTLYGGVSIVTTMILVARYYYLTTYGVPHCFGRTAWIYWPTQVSIALTAALMVTQAGSFLFEATVIKGDNNYHDAPLVAVLGCLGMGLAWVSFL